MSISRGIYNELIYRIGENMGITCILILIIIVLIAVIIGYKREFKRIIISIKIHVIRSEEHTSELQSH